MQGCSVVSHDFDRFEDFGVEEGGVQSLPKDQL